MKRSVGAGAGATAARSAEGGVIMSPRFLPVVPTEALPDHTQLPESDGSIVQNFQEHPQSMLLTGSIRPVLSARHDDGQFCIGQDCGIYFRPTDPPLQGCTAPDWFYVPDVPPTLKGQIRRSYVMWKELIAPFLIIEFVSGDGKEERDRTPNTGKFWIYEQVIRSDYYAIYEVDPGTVEVYHLIDRTYERMEPNERGHFEIVPLGVELGIWQGTYQDMELPWLRFWDARGELLLAPEERDEQHKQEVEQERRRADSERERAEQERQRAERLAARLRELGVDPDQL
jgi:Uma2 family endonuclease